MRQDQDGSFINLPKTSTSCTNPNIENWLCDIGYMKKPEWKDLQRLNLFS